MTMNSSVWRGISNHIFMRQIFQIITIGLLTFLIACGADKSESADDFSIPDPSILDFKTSDTNVNLAISKTLDYLNKVESDTELKDFYLDSVNVKPDSIVLMINHAEYYLEWRLMKEEEKKQNDLKEKENTIIEEIWIPMTGNWSRKDRTIIYLITKDSIIDILNQ